VSTAPSTDGLAALTAQRKKATSARALPSPRHSPPRFEQTPPTTPIAQPAAKPATTPPTPDAGGDLIRASIYLDAGADEFLETVRTGARRSRPKVDASRSAVVRLALARLGMELTPDQVVGELRRRASASPSTVGRKRL